MAHTMRTLNSRLPLFATEDKPTWTGDFNEAMKIMENEVIRLEGKISDLQRQITSLSNAQGGV